MDKWVINGFSVSLGFALGNFAYTGIKKLICNYRYGKSDWVKWEDALEQTWSQTVAIFMACYISNKYS
jgi:hypothetical protein